MGSKKGKGGKPAEKSSTKNPLARGAAGAVESAQGSAIQPAADTAPATEPAEEQAMSMAIETGPQAQAQEGAPTTLTHRPDARKRSNIVIFNFPDRKGSVQFLRTAFGDTIPSTITVQAPFAAPERRKELETKEQRKARLAALPKLTAEQKLAKARERVAKMEAKLAAKAAQPAAEPAA